MKIRTEPVIETTEGFKIDRMQQLIRLCDHYPLTTQEQTIGAYLSYAKSSLEDFGYNVTVRTKNENLTQIDVFWKDMLLLSSVRFFDNGAVKLQTSAGGQTDIVKTQTGELTCSQISHGAYTDFVRAELEIFASLTLHVSSNLEGERSSDWFKRNLPGAENLQVGQRLEVDFRGEEFRVGVKHDPAEILKEARANVHTWNELRPFYITSERPRFNNTLTVTTNKTVLSKAADLRSRGSEPEARQKRNAKLDTIYQEFCIRREEEKLAILNQSAIEEDDDFDLGDWGDGPSQVKSLSITRHKSKSI